MYAKLAEDLDLLADRDGIHPTAIVVTAQAGVGQDWFPLFRPLRCVEDFSQPLTDVLPAYYPAAQMELPGDFFRRVLADRDEPCLLMLDGLDEVATPQRRMEALDWIECQRKAFPHNLILVTSRFAGYRGSVRASSRWVSPWAASFIAF